MKVCIIHNIMWSHYKAVVFSKLYELAQRQNVELLVLQIARTQRQRKNMGEIDWDIHQYPLQLLFDASFEEIPISRMAARLVKEVRQFRPDIVITPGIEQPAYWAPMLFTRLWGKKLATTYDSTELDHPRVWYKEAFKKLLFSLEHLVFCYGIASKNYLNKLGVSDNRVKIRVQATDNEKIRNTYLKSLKNNNIQEQYALSEKCFLYVGRLSAEKNLDTLIRAFRSCSSDWGLIIVGAGPQQTALQQLTEELSIENVFFTGGIPWDEVSKFYAYAKVFVLPSLSEPWGLVANEAMLCNMPVLISDHCGCAPDLVLPGENGFTFSPHDTAALSHLMQCFTKGKENTEEMGKKSYEIIQNFTPEKAAQQMLEGFYSLHSK